MSTPKGWSSQEKDEGLLQEFSTVQPVGLKRYALDTNANAFVFEIGTDQAEANSTTTNIVATSHAAQVGDLIFFTSGNLANQQVRVVERRDQAIDANNIPLAETLSEAPAATDAFTIYRSRPATVSSTGGLTTTPGPVQFVLDSVDTEVSKDTATPANTIPLPVENINSSGNPVDVATAANQSTANASLATIAGDTTSLDGKVTACDTGAVTVASSALPTGAATEATLSTLDGKVTAVDTSNVTVASSALPTGAATAANQSTANGSLATLAGAVSGTEFQVDVLTSALPSGAATAANQASILAELDLDVVDTAYLDYSSTNLPGNATNPAQLIASLSADVKAIQVFDTSGVPCEIMTGAAASETRKVLLGPGTDNTVKARISSGTRVSVRRIDAAGAVSTGNIVVNFLG